MSARAAPTVCPHLHDILGLKPPAAGAQRRDDVRDSGALGARDAGRRAYALEVGEGTRVKAVANAAVCHGCGGVAAAGVAAAGVAAAGVAAAGVASATGVGRRGGGGSGARCRPSRRLSKQILNDAAPRRLHYCYINVTLTLHYCYIFSATRLLGCRQSKSRRKWRMSLRICATRCGARLMRNDVT